MKIDSATVAVITGASRGIGRAAALAFGARKANVVIASRDEERMNEVAAEISRLGGESLVVRCDASRETDCRGLIDKALARFGRVDVLVNNAGVGHYASVEDLTTEALEKMFRTNLYSAIWCTQAVLPSMKARKRGHIVNVSTVVSKRSLPFTTAYCMTKFAMNALDEGLRVEVRRYGIGVSLVCPGLTRTDFQKNAGHIGYAPPVNFRWGHTPEKVAHVILRCVERNRRQAILTAGGKTMLLLQKFFPALVDRILEIVMVRRMGKPSAS